MNNLDQLGEGTRQTLPPTSRTTPWDVVIIGAGPAGSVAAANLAAAGHATLLLDRKSFPRDKTCGDGLIPDALKVLQRLGLEETVRGRGFQTDHVTVYSPGAVSFDIPSDFVILKRVILDNLLAQHAVSRGAVFCQANVTDISTRPDGSVICRVAGQETTIHAKTALIATGANIKPAEKLRLVEKRQPDALALRHYVRSTAGPSNLVISFDTSVLPGYGWIFPLGDNEFNVGCGIPYSPKSQANLKDLFARFSENFAPMRELMRNATSQDKLEGAPLRFNLTGVNPKGPGNILLAGETIGSTFPCTGEGIGKAMETAEIAAQHLHIALTTNHFHSLNDYPEQLNQRLAHKYLGYQIAERWIGVRLLNDFMAARVARGEFLKNALSGILNESVDPRTVFSFKGIIRALLRP